jgi:asparagine synthetase B (glutamine-hydrolysing)
MCGIFCTISRGAVIEPSQNARELLRHRGPDVLDSVTRTVAEPDNLEESDKTSIHFTASVLALRGETAVPQPLQDTVTDSVLCWNGEAWKTADGVVSGNDGMVIMSLFSDASRYPDSQSRILCVIEQIRGPFALVYYDGKDKLYYGRDCLGRRSLMIGRLEDGSLIISSVADLSLNAQWSEVDADGLYVFDLSVEGGKQSVFSSTHIPSIITSADSILPSTAYLVSQVLNRFSDPMLSLSRHSHLHR